MKRRSASKPGKRALFASLASRMRTRFIVILCVIWQAAPLCRTVAASREVWEDMRRDGFEWLPLSAQYLPLAHNSATAITDELNSERLRARLAKLVGVDSTLIQKSQFRVYSEQPQISDFAKKYPEHRTRIIAQGTRWDLWAKNAGIAKEVFEKIEERVAHYVETRLNGHTAAYSLDSMEEPARVPGPTPTPRVRVLNQFPALPSKWLLDTTNSFRTVWYRPPKGSGPHVIPPFEQHEPVPLTNYVFKVVDGPITWVYHVPENGPSVDVSKQDSQEDDPAKAKLISTARKETDAWMEQKGIKGKFGSVHAYWPELKRVLKEKYSIDWLSPQDLNPNSNYD